MRTGTVTTEKAAFNIRPFEIERRKAPMEMHIKYLIDVSFHVNLTIINIKLSLFLFTLGTRSAAASRT